MKNRISVLLSASVLFGLSSGARAVPPPAFDLAKYQQLIATAGAKGELLQDGSGLDYKVLSHLDPTDATKPHRADYFAAVGGTDSSGHFGAIQVSMESEDWRKRPNGDWEIEQWMWTASTDGTLGSVAHSLLVENSGGSVLDDQNLPAGEPTDAAEIARWGAKVTEWNGFAP